MAMDMARSLAHLLMFFFLLAARDLAGAATSNLDEACDETQFPDLCARSLLAYPESRTASPRRLAELSVLAALNAGREAVTFAHYELNNVDDDGLLRCLDSCSADVEEAVAHLSALSREPTDAKFLEAKAWLSATLDGAAAYEAVCKDAPVSDVNDAAVAKSVEFDMMLRVTLDLITEASGSMSATVALDSARSPAYGAPYGSPAYGAGGPSYGYGAPSYGAPSYGGARKPRVPAPAPFRGYGRRRPRAPAPSPFGGYGTRMPVAPAPLPSRGYGHRRPRAPTPSRKPCAPAPSPLRGYGASAPSYGAPSPSYGAGHPRAPVPSRRPRAPAPSPFGGYGASAGAPSYGARRPRAPAPSPSYGARRTRAPAPSPFGGYGSARRPRAPAPSPFVAYGAPAGGPAYGARRPGAPAPSRGASRPPPPSTFFSIFNTDETA